jgi:SPP1 gp7 family putative phage head morphogenesis protein
VTLSDNKRLYDVATRHKVYIESVKAGFAPLWNEAQAELSDELSFLLGRVRYKTMDGLTKSELNKLVAALRFSQTKIYSRYTEKILRQMEDFMAADLEVSRRTYAYTHIELLSDSEKPPEIPTDRKAIAYIEEQNKALGLIPLFGIAAVAGSDDRMWSAIKSTPLPASGMYLLPLLKTFTTTAQAGTENAIRKAWANGDTVADTMANIIGTSAKQGTASQLQRVAVQASAVISTAIQHAASMTGAGVLSALYKEYIWRSVIDGRTSDICRFRNGLRYTFGKGPLPPAHMNCRSHISPVIGPDNAPDEGFYEWAARQPEAIQDDILGKGNRPAGEPKYRPRKSLTNEQYKRKINLILSR